MAYSPTNPNGQASGGSSSPVVLNVEAANGNITTQNLVPAGTATANSAVEITLLGANTIGVQVTGTYTGALSLQITIDGTNWITIGGTPLINVNTGLYLASITSALQSIFQGDVGGAVKARITGLAAMTGTATVTIRAMQNPAMIALDAALPAGAATIGAVNIAAAQTLATVTTLTTLANGQTAHSSASSGSPLRIGGRVAPITIATVDTTLVAGDASEVAVTTAMQQVVKPYGPSELDITIPVLPVVTTTTAQTILPASGTASVRNNITGITIQTDTLGAAGTVYIVDGQGAIGTSATIATPGVFTSSTHDLRVGDCIIFTSLGSLTNVVTNTLYYVTATSFAATTFTVASTPGGTALQVTGGTSAFTFYRVFYAMRLQTTAIVSPIQIKFDNPLKCMANVATNIYIPSSLTSGVIYLTVTGYRGY